MELADVYKQLTDVEINEQKQLWDERGRGYYGEYLVFCELYKCISGNSKIIMNLNIPVNASSTTEVDLILIHETGIYVFEIKHYKGTIYGKDTDKVWTQYFRTAKNNSFKNPIEQNKYHISALKKLFPDIAIHSVIVFTNFECDLRVNNSSKDIDVCLLSRLYNTLENRFKMSAENMSMEEINSIFVQLSKYSPMLEKVVIDKVEASFFSWIQPAVEALNSQKAETEVEKSKWNIAADKMKKAKFGGILANIAVAVLCIVITGFVNFGLKKEYADKISAFEQKFLHVDEINNEYIDDLRSYTAVSNVSLQPLTDDAVAFTARIAVTNDVYGIMLTENSKYIVMTDSGKTFEYNVFGEHLRYSKLSNTVGKGYREYSDLAKIQFYGINDINDISYIKLTDIELFKIDMNRTVIKSGLEIELYSK